MAGLDPLSTTISQVSESIRTRQLSPVELTRSCIEQAERLDPRGQSIHGRLGPRTAPGLYAHGRHGGAAVGLGVRGEVLSPLLPA